MKKIINILLILTMLSFSNLSFADNFFVGFGYSPSVRYVFSGKTLTSNENAPNTGVYKGTGFSIIGGYHLNSFRFYLDMAPATELKDTENSDIKIKNYNYSSLGVDYFFGSDKKSFYLGWGHRMIGDSKIGSTTIKSNSHFYADIGYLYAFDESIHLDIKLDLPLSTGTVKVDETEFKTASANLAFSLIYAF